MPHPYWNDRNHISDPLDRTSHLRQLTADLMVPPRLQIDLQQIIIIRMGDQFITQDGFLGIRPLGIVSVTLILLLVPHQPIHQLTLILRGRFLTIAQYVLRTSPTRNISFKREGLARLGENHDPLTGRSRRCVTPTKTLPGLQYFSFSHAFSISERGLSPVLSPCTISRQVLSTAII